MISTLEIPTPELVNQLHSLCYENNPIAAQFRGWLVGNDVPFTEEFEDNDGVIFILDEYPTYGFTFESENEGLMCGLVNWSE